MQRPEAPRPGAGAAIDTICLLLSLIVPQLPGGASTLPPPRPYTVFRGSLSHEPVPDNNPKELSEQNVKKQNNKHIFSPQGRKAEVISKVKSQEIALLSQTAFWTWEHVPYPFVPREENFL